MRQTRNIKVGKLHFELLVYTNDGFTHSKMSELPIEFQEAINAARCAFEDYMINVLEPETFAPSTDLTDHADFTRLANAILADNGGPVVS